MLPVQTSYFNVFLFHFTFTFVPILHEMSLFQFHLEEVSPQGEQIDGYQGN